MNHKLIAIHCQIPVTEAARIPPQSIIDYLVFLFRMSRTGGFSIEEELWVDSMAASLDIHDSLAEEAFSTARAAELSVEDAAAKLVGTPLINAAFLDACRIAILDGVTSYREAAALKTAKKAFGLTEEFCTQALQLAKKEEHLLIIFCHLAELPDPADTIKGFLSIGFRDFAKERKMLCPNPDRIPVKDRLHALALILRLSGIGWRKTPDEWIIDGFSKYLQLAEPEFASAEDIAWGPRSSMENLATQISDLKLQGLTFREAHRICLGDSRICDVEKQFLRSLSECFGFGEELLEALTRASSEEIDLLKALCRHKIITDTSTRGQT